MFAIQRQEARSCAVETVTATPNRCCYHPHFALYVPASFIFTYTTLNQLQYVVTRYDCLLLELRDKISVQCQTNARGKVVLVLPIGRMEV